MPAPFYYAAKLRTLWCIKRISDDKVISRGHSESEAREYANGMNRVAQIVYHEQRLHRN